MNMLILNPFIYRKLSRLFIKQRRLVHDLLYIPYVNIYLQIIDFDGAIIKAEHVQWHRIEIEMILDCAAGEDLYNAAFANRGVPVIGHELELQAYRIKAGFNKIRSSHERERLDWMDLYFDYVKHSQELQTTLEESDQIRHKTAVDALRR